MDYARLVRDLNNPISGRGIQQTIGLSNSEMRLDWASCMSWTHDTTWLSRRSRSSELGRCHSSPRPEHAALSACRFQSRQPFLVAHPRDCIGSLHRRRQSVFRYLPRPSRAVQRFSLRVMHRTDGVDNDVASIWTSKHHSK